MNRRDFLKLLPKAGVALAVAIYLPEAKRQVAKRWHIFNIKDFGAVGDGKADDTAAIQAAVDAARNGGTIVGSGGIYRITAPVVLHGHTHLRDVHALVEGDVGFQLEGSWNTISNTQITPVEDAP